MNEIILKLPGYDYVCNLSSKTFRFINENKSEMETPAVLVATCLSVIALSVMCRPYGMIENQQKIKKYARK